MSHRPGPLAVAVTVAAVVVLAAGALAARPHGLLPFTHVGDPGAVGVVAADGGPGPVVAPGSGPDAEPATTSQEPGTADPGDEPLVLGPSAPVPGVPVVPAPAGAAPAQQVQHVVLEPAKGRPDAPRTAQSWIDSTSAAAGVPAAALRAYGDATLALAAGDPGCHLGWTTLAAVGAVESGHGTHGGSQLDADGKAVPPILGPALSGSGFAAIHATPRSTALHGDPVWDHAVGPMQFIPSTWWRWGADGDGDGQADPQDIDDAALSAALYLCASRQDMSTPTGWAAAVRSYNHSDAYVATVLRFADTYASRVP